MRFAQTPTKQPWLGIPLDQLECPHDLDLDPIKKEMAMAVPDLKAKNIFRLVDIHEKAK